LIDSCTVVREDLVSIQGRRGAVLGASVSL
jgi:hypothetical protein